MSYGDRRWRRAGIAAGAVLLLLSAAAGVLLSRTPAGRPQQRLVPVPGKPVIVVVSVPPSPPRASSPRGISQHDPPAGSGVKRAPAAASDHPGPLPVPPPVLPSPSSPAPPPVTEPPLPPPLFRLCLPLVLVTVCVRLSQGLTCNACRSLRSKRGQSQRR